MKMLLCCDVISLIKRKHKQLKMQRSLSAKRVTFQRPTSDSGRYTMLAHAEGKQKDFYYERDAQSKTSRVNTLAGDLSVPRSAALMRKSQNILTNIKKKNEKKRNPHSQPEWGHEMRTRSIKSDSSQRYGSLEAYERLTGSVAFRPANRHGVDQVRKRLEEEGEILPPADQKT